MSKTAVARRAQQARAYLLIADLALTDRAMPGHTNVAGANAVLAGIAASDAICGHALGVRPVGEAHDDAITLLKRASVPTSRAPAQLKRLLSSKTDTQYSPDLVSENTATALVNSAQRLIDEMNAVLRS